MIYLFSAVELFYVLCILGVLPTTDKICVLRHKDVQHAKKDGSSTDSSNATINTSDDDCEEIYVDDEFLRSVALVDTPGTNGLIEKHAALTQEVIPRSDLILFVTSGTILHCTVLHCMIVM